VAGTSGGHATLWNGTIATYLDTRDTFLGSSAAYGINSGGQVAGEVTSHRIGINTATLWNWNGPGLAALPGSSNSGTRAINDAGQVAGWTNPTLDWYGDSSHATLWDGTTVTALGTLGGSNSSASAINNAAQVAGWANTTGDAAQHAVLWNGTSATDLGTLGGVNSQANAVNNAGQVAGWAQTTVDNAQHAALWNGTTTTDLNSFLDASTANAGWVLTTANGINDHGWIVGDAHNSKSGVDHAFLLTPIPEPETYAMLLAGLGLVSFMARRRKSVCITYTLHS
jgi:probable HAF family extracellular repeat protein